MFLATSLEKTHLNQLNEFKSIKDEYPRLDKIAEYIKNLQPLKGKRIYEIGGKRLSATAFALGDSEARDFDAGHDTGEGHPQEGINLKEHKKLIPFKADISYSQWALEDGSGEIGFTRFSDSDDKRPLEDCLADVLSVLANTTKENGFSIHSYSSPELMRKFAKGELSNFLRFVGFEVVHYAEKNYEKDLMGDDCVVFKKIKPDEDTKNWTF